MEEACPINHMGRGTCYLDHRGAHAVSCVAAKATRSKWHKILNNRLASFVNEAFCQTRTEPKTYDILQRAIPEQAVNLMFAERPNGASKQHVATVKQKLGYVRRMVEQRASQTEINKAVEDLEREIHNPPPSAQGHGLRIDVEIRSTLAQHANQVRWIDASIFESACDTYIKAQLEWHEKHWEAEDAAWKRGRILPPTQTPSHAMKTKVAEKHTKYAPVMNVAELQHLRRQRASRPAFVACVASHTGELAPEFLNFVLWLGKQYQHGVGAGQAGFNGQPAARRTADFRKRLLDTVQVILASAKAELMIGAGGHYRAADWMSVAGSSEAAARGGEAAA